MAAHVYKCKDGKRVPSVTTIISGNLGWGREQLMHWAWKQGVDGKEFREERDTAATIGTIAHAYAEADIKGKARPVFLAATPEMLEKANSAYAAYEAWKKMSRVKLHCSEISLVSEVRRYGGTLDGVGLVNDAVCLVDFKTSSGTYPAHIIQIAAYSRLWAENFPNEPLSGGIHLLRFGKEEGDFHHSHYPLAAMAKALEAFDHLSNLHDLQKVIRKLT